MHHAVARQRRVLFVQSDHPAGEPLVLERLAEYPGRGDRFAVIGEPKRTGVAELRHLGQLLPLEPAGDRCQEADGDACLAARGVGQRPQTAASSTIGAVLGIAITAQKLPAAAAVSRRDVLLVLLARCAQVDVGVDKGRERVLAGRFDDVAVGRRGARRRQLGDPPVADHDVPRLV